jgi:hypothetical protein
LLTQVDLFTVKGAALIIDTSFHHLAVAKSGENVVFYVDGKSSPAPAFSPTFDFATAAALGARGDDLGNSFLGTIDETAVYNRALSDAEIQAIYTAGTAGKCLNQAPAPSTTATNAHQKGSSSAGTQVQARASSDGANLRTAEHVYSRMQTPVPVRDGFLISFTGSPGTTYTLQRAESLTGPWVTLAKVTANASGDASYTDTGAPSATAYYRTVYP